MTREVETGFRMRSLSRACRESAWAGQMQVEDLIGLMLRSPPCPKGEVGVSKHGAAPSSYVPCQAPKAQQPGLSTTRER
jgi:hypothetical protein